MENKIHYFGLIAHIKIKTGQKGIRYNNYHNMLNKSFQMTLKELAMLSDMLCSSKCKKNYNINHKKGRFYLFPLIIANLINN